MDNSSAQTEKSSFIDTVKLLLSAAALFSGLFSYYYYLQVSLPLRVLMVLGGLLVGTAIAMTSFQGKQLFSFIQSSRIEIRKVVRDPNAANKAYCFTGIRFVIARAVNPIEVVTAVKKIGVNKFLIVLIYPCKDKWFFKRKSHQSFPLDLYQLFDLILLDLM